MKSFIAALRDLVLPYGATSGLRIVLDGVTGRISVFDASNDEVIAIFPHQISTYDSSHNEIVRIDDIGVAVFDTSLQLRARLSTAGFESFNNLGERTILAGPAGSIELFSRQTSENLTADIQAAGIGSGGSASRRAELVLESPNLTGGAGGGNRSQIEMLSESYDGTIDTLIQYLANVHDFLPSDGNNPDIQLNSKTLPRGIMDVARITSTPATFTTEADISGLSVTWNAISGRYYKITCTGRGMTSTALGNMRASITDSSNNHVAESDVRVDAVSNIGGTVALQYTIPGTVSGSVTYKVRAAVLTGGGTGTYAAISEITVEDIGIP